MRGRRRRPCLRLLAREFKLGGVPDGAGPRVLQAGHAAARIRFCDAHKRIDENCDVKDDTVQPRFPCCHDGESLQRQWPPSLAAPNLLARGHR